MKQCSKCKLEKAFSEFWKHARSSDGFQSWCKGCSSTRRLEYYQENKEKEASLRDEWNKKYAEWYRSLKEGLPCSECSGVFFHGAMQWHHVSSDKLANVADIARHRRAKSLVLAEIEKCRLVCANCHARLTWSEEDCLVM